MADKRGDIATLLLCYLFALEGLSWFTASMPPCLISEAHEQQTADDDNQKECPTFFVGSAIAAGRLVSLLKSDDNDKAVVAAFTIILAFSTIGLWLATHDLQKTTRDLAKAGERQIAVAKRAADAALLSARAAIGIQLPVIRIEPEQLSHQDGFVIGGDPYEECTVHSVMLLNLGSSRALPAEILYGWTIGEVLPERPSYRASEKFQPDVILEPNAKPGMKTLSLGMPLKPGEWPKICGGNFCWFYCTLLYDDFMETRREAAFCWRWANTGAGLSWRKDATPAYNRKGEYPLQ
jgi:hypothetical protein